MVAEVIVTVRMPASLLTALKERTAQDHFSDISEQVRSIVRKGCIAQSLQLRSQEQSPEEILKSLQRALQGGGR